jgi:predicted nucleic acid-binding protein
MRDAITDTGPVLHLSEIGQLETLRVFDHLVMPDLVVAELRSYGLESSELGVPGLTVTEMTVDATDWSTVIRQSNQPAIQPADAQVFVLARASQFKMPVLTDDLSLRKRLEDEGA